MFCQQQVAQLRDVVDEIRGRGADLIVVGNGGVEQARVFRDAQELPFALYTDPSLESYRLAGLRHGLGSSMSPRVALHAVAALRQGFRQHRTQGDPVQQGGVFVIAKGGGLLYQYVSREAGDHPDNADLLRALDENAANRQRT
jgi:peroxiredoxin